MQLKAFDKKEKAKNNKTTILVVVVFLFVVTLVLGKSFAYYQKEEEKRVSDAQVGVFCTIGQTWDFNYVEDEAGNGYEQDFEIPCTGTYKLEVWGAQGGYGMFGAGKKEGGYGGYSSGEIDLLNGTKLYLAVGGKGEDGYKKFVPGGYNGGGTGSYANSSLEYSGGGGGATHITTTNRGVLSNYSSNISDILIVAGGGGGGSTCATKDVNNIVGGGSGGGYNGGSNYEQHATGANLFGSGIIVSGIGQVGSFGKGADGYVSSLSVCQSSGGGGGGYYGGVTNNYSGTGGSGYLEKENLKEKVMYCYNCEESEDENTRTISTTNVSDNPVSEYAKKGHGYARITYLGYSEPELNGADPVLANNLIPVTIENDGTVRKADISKEWYNYKNKEWANAVILVDKTKSYSIKDIIPESNIESYFVWIPKYSYQLWDLGNYNSLISGKPTTSNEREIQIRFGIYNTSDSNTGECTTPMTSGGSGNCSLGDWMTHPAFISMNTTGLWVGKFETRYKGATTTAEAQISSNDATKIIVKPNVYSWRYNSVYNQFVSSYNYQRTLDSHMMKNTEWGAVAYLSHSKYGINDEVRVNNNSSYLTGYSASNAINLTVFPGIMGTTEDKTLPYNTSIGYKASTTGNITGIYDMSGCSDEYMASYMSGKYGTSGFDATTIASYNNKYFDVYSSLSDSESFTYQYRILGDATGEVGPFYLYPDSDGNNRRHSWYEDNSVVLHYGFPWFHRGGRNNYGVLSGLFYFDHYKGGAETFGSRLVLAP